MRLSLVPRLHVDFTLLSLALEAHLEELLDALIRLSSHGSLVSLDLVARDEDTVHGDDHAILEMEDVTAVEVVSVDFHFGGNSIVATTGDIDVVVIFVLLLTLHELFLLSPIDKGRKSGNDEDGHVNSSAIKPSMTVIFGICSDVFENEGAGGRY